MGHFYDDGGVEAILWHEFTQGRGLALRNDDQSLLVDWEAHPAVAKTYCARDTPCVTHYVPAALPMLRARVRDFLPRAQRVFVSWTPPGENERRLASRRDGERWTAFSVVGASTTRAPTPSCP